MSHIDVFWLNCNPNFLDPPPKKMKSHQKKQKTKKKIENKIRFTCLLFLCVGAFQEVALFYDNIWNQLPSCEI